MADFADGTKGADLTDFADGTKGADLTDFADGTRDADLADFVDSETGGAALADFPTVFLLDFVEGQSKELQVADGAQSSLAVPQLSGEDQLPQSS